MSTPLPPNRIAFPTTRSVFLWLVLFYVVFSVVYNIVQSSITTLPDFEDSLVTHILYSCSFISLCFYLRQKLHQAQLDSSYVVGNLRPRYPWLSLLGLAIVFLLFSLGAAILSFKTLSLIAPEWYESFIESAAKQESQISAFPLIDRCWQTINYVVVAPITEEYIFRGILLHRLATKWNLPVAIWVSSIVFGLLHPNPIGISAVGLAWALLYLKTRTLVVPIVAHSINNTIAVMGEFASTLVENNDSAIESASNMGNAEWIAGLLLISISLPFVVGFVYRRFPPKDISLPYVANEAKAIASSL